MVQRHGTEFIGSIFGPVMMAWFAVIAIMGIGGIVRAPAILAALNPLSAVTYLLHAGPGISFAVLMLSGRPQMSLLTIAPGSTYVQRGTSGFAGSP